MPLSEQTPQNEHSFLVLKKVGSQLLGIWRFITASDLGTGGSGTGNKYLADDMTWKTISGSGGGGTGLGIDLGDRITGSSYIDMGSRT